MGFKKNMCRVIAFRRARGILFAFVCLVWTDSTFSAPETLIEARPGGAVRVMATKVAISELLTTFGQSFGITFQLGPLTETVRTVNCEERDLRLLLKCLSGEGVSFMIRHSAAACTGKSSPWCGSVIKVWDDDAKSKMIGALSRLRERAPSIEALLKSPISSTRAQGIDALLANHDVEGPLALSLLKDFAADPSSDVRASAVHGLAVFEGAESEALILRATQDGSPEVRLAGIDAMASAEDARAVLERALKDSDADVRELASMRLQSLLYNAGENHEEN